MKYTSKSLSTSEVQEVAEFLGRYADRRRDDSALAEEARKTFAADRARKDSDRIRELLTIMSSGV